MPAILKTAEQTICSHCGEICPDQAIRIENKYFCCGGCKMVYQILEQNELCGYYDLNSTPGINQRVISRKDKFNFLNDEKIQAQLIRFKDESNIHVTFFLPQMHCSSCLYLLENLNKLDKGIVSCEVNFVRKEANIVINYSRTSLRQLAELLTSIGYEPYISLSDIKQKRPAVDKSMIYQLGIAGFCFGNIMLMSFPEYLGIDESETELRNIFRWINFSLSLPVLLYSAMPFYTSAWRSLRHKFLNIDAPIALAIIITFGRSAWEVMSGQGGGYFDSMTGIVFFMLAGRIVQDKTFRQLSFERDYTSYFPIAVTLIRKEGEVTAGLPDIKPGDTLLIHNEELIPADGILTRGNALIDYSFVTGESIPVLKQVGELVYAGGRQKGTNIEVLLVKEVTQSYLTSLWNKKEMNDHRSPDHSFVHLLSRYFTLIVFAIAAVTAIYWQVYDASKIWPAVTAIFIIACPCALLLSNSFTNGNILTILARNHFFLKDATTIENIAKTTHIVFDKTGTLTTNEQLDIEYKGSELTDRELNQIATLANCSSHPLAQSLARFIGKKNLSSIEEFKETNGEGMEGLIDGDLIRIGSERFVNRKPGKLRSTSVFVSIRGKTTGRFIFQNHYREVIPMLIDGLRSRYRISVVSGDNDSEQENLQKLLGPEAILLFNQGPADKMNFVKSLQENGEKVMMIGDGLNDAGALKQSDAGIAVTEKTNNFTPSSDGIIEAKQLSHFHSFLSLCRYNRHIVTASFVLSILYNLIGLFFAVQGNLSPLIAAILMPASSLSIVLITFGASNLFARRMGL